MRRSRGDRPRTHEKAAGTRFTPVSPLADDVSSRTLRGVLLGRRGALSAPPPGRCRRCTEAYGAPSSRRNSATALSRQKARPCSPFSAGTRAARRDRHGHFAIEGRSSIWRSLAESMRPAQDSGAGDPSHRTFAGTMPLPGLVCHQRWSRLNSHKKFAIAANAALANTGEL